MTRINWDRKCSKPQSWIYKIDRKFGPPPPPRPPNQRWEKGAFWLSRGFILDLGGWGFTVLFYYVQECRWEKRQVNNVMKQIVLRIIPSRLRHVAVIAIFLGDGKPRKSLKKWIRTVSNFIDLIQFHFLSNIGEIFWGWIQKDRIYV